MVVLEAAILVVLLLFTAAAKLLLSLPLTEEGVLVPTCKGCLGGGGAILLLLAASGFDCAYAPATAFWVILPSICLTGTTFSFDAMAVDFLTVSRVVVEFELQRSFAWNGTE
jgi:hypothetical protein